jgi:hypothetical protein
VAYVAAWQGNDFAIQKFMPKLGSTVYHQILFFRYGHAKR